MFEIYDASARKPTTLTGLAEHVRVVLRGGGNVDARLPVFRQNRLTKEWVKTTLRVQAMTTPSGAVRIRMRVVQSSKNGEDVYYKRELQKPYILSNKEWRDALKTLNLRLKKPTPKPVRKSPAKREHMR